MKFTITARVTGAKYFNDSVEGQHYDKTTLYIETDLDDGNGRCFGKCTMPYEWGSSENYAKISHLKQAFEADVTFEQVTTGKAQKMRVVDLKPKARAAAGAV